MTTVQVLARMAAVQVPVRKSTVRELVRKMVRDGGKRPGGGLGDARHGIGQDLPDPVLDLLGDLTGRSGRVDDHHFAIGDAEAIVARIAPTSKPGFRNSSCARRPGDAEMLAQTRRLVEEVLPLVAARWPRPSRRAAAVAAE